LGGFRGLLSSPLILNLNYSVGVGSGVDVAVGVAVGNGVFVAVGVAVGTNFAISGR